MQHATLIKVRGIRMKGCQLHIPYPAILFPAEVIPSLSTRSSERVVNTRTINPGRLNTENAMVYDYS